MDKIEWLKKLNSDKLIDIVKKYRQFGYDDNLRANAILLLEERGISKDKLEMAVNFENKKDEIECGPYNSFKKNSKIALVLYGLLFLSSLLVPVLLTVSETMGLSILIIASCLLLFFFVFVTKSFLNQNQFYKGIGREYGTEGALLYLFLGMPLYILMYFFFRNQMKRTKQDAY